MVLVPDLTAGRPLRCHVGLVLLRRRETIMPVRCVARPQFWKRTRRASLRRRAVRRNPVMRRKRPRRCETPGWVGWWCPAGDRGRQWRPIPGMRADRLTPEGEACLPTSYSGEEWTGPCFHAEEAGWRWRTAAVLENSSKEMSTFFDKNMNRRALEKSSKRLTTIPPNLVQLVTVHGSGC